MKIVFLTDLTSESMLNIKTALSKLVVDFSNTEVVLLHILDLTSIGDDFSNEKANDAINKLFWEKGYILETLGIKVTPIVRSGDYLNELNNTLEKINPDMVIVLLSYNHQFVEQGEEDVFLTIIGEIVAPVLIISPKDVLKGIDEMAIALDESDIPNAKTLDSVNKIASFFKSNVKTFHVITSPNEEPLFYEKTLEDLGVVKVGFIKEPEVTKGIRNWCNRNQIDLPIIITSPKSFYRRVKEKSVTHDLVREKFGSLLIITQ